MLCFVDNRYLVAELPFTLMHPKPEDDSETARPSSSGVAPTDRQISSLQAEGGDTPIDTNLIQLDT